MLRLSSSASARVIGSSGRSIIARHQRQSLKFQSQQQRFIGSRKSVQPTKTDSAGGSAKNTNPPVIPGGATPRAPAKPPPVVATPPKPPRTPTSAAPSSTSPTQVPPAPPLKTQVFPLAQASGGPSSSAAEPPTPPPRAAAPPRAPSPAPAAASPKLGAEASKVSPVSPPITVSPVPETQTPQPAQSSKPPLAPSKTAATSAPPPQTETPPPTPSPKVSPPPAPAATPPPPPPSPPPVSPPTDFPKPPKKKRRFRNFVVGLTLLTVLSFGSGVFYSLKSDNFRDFFTEYVRFGEEAVTYFEDREFRRRFPNAFSRAPPKPVDPNKAAILKASELTKKATDMGKPGPHISARGAGDQEKEGSQALGSSAMTRAGSQKPAAPILIDEKPFSPAQDTQIAKTEGKPKQNLFEIPLLEPKDAEDPVVQNLATVVNSIITLTNQSGSAEVFDSAISSAKSELSRLSDQITNIKQSLKKSAEEQLKQKDLEFTTVAQGLLQNVDNEITNIEHRWKDEFEAEREKMANSYRAKLQTELQRSSQVAEHRLRNELLEQAIEMKRKWIGEIEDRVEQERDGRLGKLKELSDTVDELTELSTAWAGVIDANLKTQNMHVAIGAVRAAIESPEQPKPFLRELAALKEIGDDNEVVRVAIASINPLAYQKGVPTAAQLVDRFRRVSDEVRKASLLPENAGIAGHAASWVLSKVLFKKKGLAQGDDVESILTRTETYLEEGDIDNAAREMNQLKGWAKILARDWLKEARLLLEVQQAIDVIVTEARLQSLRVQGGY